MERLYGCPYTSIRNYRLSWDFGRPHPMAKITAYDSVRWELIPQGNNLYVIRSKRGCPGSEHCEAELSWDYGTGNHPLVSVEHGDRVLWEIIPRGGGHVVRSKWGCPSDEMCNAEISCDGIGRVNLKFHDPIIWQIRKVKGWSF